MSRDQRVRYNDALLAAQQHAMSCRLPLVVVFALHSNTSRRSLEHVEFMLEGLAFVAQDLAQKNIPFTCQIGDQPAVIREVIQHITPAAVYIDFSPLRRSRRDAESLASSMACPVFIVDTHNIVPVWEASEKCEYAARTIRPKIHRQLGQYFDEPPTVQAQEAFSLSLPDSIDLAHAVSQLSYKKSGIEHAYVSGEAAAGTALKSFIEERLQAYAHSRNDPTLGGLSRLSPYFHFGQLSSLEAVMRVEEAVASDAGLRSSADTFIEEAVIRKELSDNWCYYSDFYDNLDGAPEWAQKTLEKHRGDPREYLYSREQFEQAQTHDPAWNAAQQELTQTGKMHGYMRMYWAKKALEWSESPEQAIDILVYLNDFYSLDGGDPNGYAGIMWSVAGVHDRPWGERPVYGTIRSMVYTGLKRKFNVEQYIDKYTK